MCKAYWVLLGLFTLSSFAYADDSPFSATGMTLAAAQAAVALATTALDQATAWENLARRNLDTANKALAKTPKSPTAKQAAATARKELDSATAYKTRTTEELRERSAIAQEAARENNAEATSNVTVYPEEKYKLFAREYAPVERLDAFSFYNNPFEYDNKTVILDAKFDEMTAPGEAKFTIWRHFGNMHLIVSNFPAEDVIQKDKTMLLSGIITGFKKEVISGELILKAMLRLKAIFVCANAQCPE